MAILQSTTIATTLTLPKGTTAERPGSPSQGMSRFNTTINQVETYNGASWIPLDGDKTRYNRATVATSSGTHQVENQNGYRVHVFLSGGHTFTPTETGFIEVLVVAGGGG